VSLSLTFPEGATRHPGRHEVVDALLGGERVVVKKVPITARQRLARRTKGEKSLATAQALLARGVGTPEPVGVEIREGESWYVARKVEGALQIRAWFLNRDDPTRFPRPAGATFEEVVAAVARLARRMHDGGVFFRDFTDGNVLVTREGENLRLWLVDLDRARVGERPLGTFSRLRDLARLGLNAPEDRNLLLERYFELPEVPTGWTLALGALRHRIVVWDALKRAVRPWRR
jgi:tRNA A-37 threonylcarbamoyl transferase component Bud32